ncbi:hypothetical protein GX865_03825 [Candidatus Saccharibacteria bacterium]|jgi:hypothetical protein|nr:hypothetical protein [Candidatus Saccharibacteria bacterium]
MNPEYQYILARDTIDMIRDYQNDTGVLEYLDSLCFSIARLVEGKSVVEWGDLASICDQRYYSLKQGEPVPIDTKMLNAMYTKYENRIQKNQKTQPS